MYTYLIGPCTPELRPVSETDDVHLNANLHTIDSHYVPLLFFQSTLKTTPSQDIEDIRRFFDAFAIFNGECHGPPDRLLQYRVALLKRYARIHHEDVVLDVGCGNGHHLFALNGAFRRGIGIDFSPKMIASALHARPATETGRLLFEIDDAHSLATVADASVDVAVCIGALEHMPDKAAVARSIHRVLRPGGRFVSLTPNDEFVWYRRLAPTFGIPTRHLATDRRLDTGRALTLLHQAGFSDARIDYWSFIPRGDMPTALAGFCRLLDRVGRLALPRHFRSGLVLVGEK
jgi:2-polyprenyl-6-hydroxyphenyl methylase/3-demethylubiquinone-9 3-methyltransferase